MTEGGTPKNVQPPKYAMHSERPPHTGNTLPTRDSTTSASPTTTATTSARKASRQRRRAAALYILIALKPLPITRPKLRKIPPSPDKFVHHQTFTVQTRQHLPHVLGLIFRFALRRAPRLCRRKSPSRRKHAGLRRRSGRGFPVSTLCCRAPPFRHGGRQALHRKWQGGCCGWGCRFRRYRASCTKPIAPRFRRFGRGVSDGQT